MGQFHNITQADKVSTWKSSYAQGDGDDMQDWFIKADGIDKPIKTTTKIDSPAPSGQTYGAMEEFQSKKSGKPYFKFKRAKTPDGMVKPPETVVPTTGGSGILQEVHELVKANNILLKMLNGETKVEELKQDRGDDSAKDEVVLDDIDNEPVDLSDIPF